MGFVTWPAKDSEIEILQSENQALKSELDKAKEFIARRCGKLDYTTNR